MKQLIISLFVLSLNSITCNNRLAKYQEQIKITNNFIESIRRNDTSSAKKMLGVNPKDIGLDDEKISLTIAMINKVFQRAGVASTDMYKYIEYSNDSPNLVDIIIPIIESNVKDEYIIVSFVKYIEDGKIYNFQLIRPIPKSFDDLSPPVKNAEQEKKKNE